ncbi:DUF2142 domain-containing protein [Agromyces sp. PvR057]|uniref:DUF2142 domain-containing protein n=1 Tax=Agromyces sp. PvR057 TaxID=3156403 RepID=UPI0033951FAB
MTPPSFTPTPTAAKRRPRIAFWVTFLALFLAIGGWSIVNPAMASPDEPAHAVKAAATVRGEFTADESEYNAGRGTFEVPELFAQVWNLTCYAFHPETTPNCSPGISGDLSAPSESASHVARYNPVYYTIIGLPSLLPIGAETLTLMRLASALLNAFLIALLVRTIFELRRPFWPLIGVVAATTPMAIYIASSMTPQGPEIFGAMLTLVVLLAMTREPDEGLISRRMWRLVIGAAFFVLARGLSPAYLAFIVVIAVLVSPRWSTVWDVIRNRRIWPQLGLCIAASVGAVVYTLASGSLALGIVLPEPGLTATQVVTRMLRNTDYYFEQLIGVFGWGDTHLPIWTQMLIVCLVGLVIIVGLAMGTWRERAAVAVVGVATLIVPIAVQLLSYKESGLVWQGKYVMPIALAAPILAGFFAERGPMTMGVAKRVAPFVVGIAGAGQVIAFAVNTHRYVNGANGPWTALIEGAWLPPINMWLALTVEILVWVGLTVAVALATRLPDGGESFEPGVPALVDARYPDGSGLRTGADEGEHATPADEDVAPASAEQGVHSADPLPASSDSVR